VLLDAPAARDDVDPRLAAPDLDESGSLLLGNRPDALLQTRRASAREIEWTVAFVPSPAAAADPGVAGATTRVASAQSASALPRFRPTMREA
jgi:hypothetical protein